MYKCNYKNLTLSFNEFHNLDKDHIPQYGEFCLLELKDGSYTGGKWYPNSEDSDNENNNISGQFIRGLADTIQAEEVSRWHSLDKYSISECLEYEEVEFVNIGPKEEDSISYEINDFKSIEKSEFPKSEQYCLLIMKDGGLAAGRWDEYIPEEDGSFVYGTALASYSMEAVWAWTPLSPDDTFLSEEELVNEKKQEEELNKNPTTDPEKFKYGTDIDIYYEKALKKHLKKYPWASMTQMKKPTPWSIVPLHGQYVFGQIEGSYKDSMIIKEWKDGNTADEFVDFLCDYTREAMKNANPDKKFKYGLDIDIYLDKAFNNVKRDYRWLEKKMLNKICKYDIRQIDGDYEFVKKYKMNKEYFICDYGLAEDFIKCIESDYKNAALEANPVIDQYSPTLSKEEIHGWHLERYEFSKLKTGDYKVYVQAGDRVTGGSRVFFITPDCFEAKTYSDFLDRYLKIVPGEHFGMHKKDLVKDVKLKKFLGY